MFSEGKDPPRLADVDHGSEDGLVDRMDVRPARVAPAPGNRADQPVSGLQGSRERADVRVPLGDQVADPGRFVGVDGAGDARLQLVDLVEVADQGGDPGGRVASLRRDRAAGGQQGPPLVVAEEVAER